MIAVAVPRSVRAGREFGKGTASAAVEYSKKYPQVKSIDADSLGHRLVVTFESGWNTQVTPITDGKGGDETEGLPK